MSIFSLLAARSISTFETPAWLKRALRFVPQIEVLVQQLGVVAVRVPPRPPRLVVAEPEPVWMNLLAHGDTFVLVLVPSFARRRRPSSDVLVRGRGLVRAAAVAPPRPSAPPGGPPAARPLRPSGASCASPRGRRAPSAPAARASATAPGPRSRPHVEPLRRRRRSRPSAGRWRSPTSAPSRCPARPPCARTSASPAPGPRPRRGSGRAPAPPSGPRCARTSPSPVLRSWLASPPSPTLAAFSVFDVCPRKVRVGANSPELVADHVLGDVDRDELLPVVHGDRVPDHLGHHGRSARPGLDRPSCRRRGSSPPPSRGGAGPRTAPSSAICS